MAVVVDPKIRTTESFRVLAQQMKIVNNEYTFYADAPVKLLSQSKYLMFQCHRHILTTVRYPPTPPTPTSPGTNRKNMKNKVHYLLLHA